MSFLTNYIKSFSANTTRALECRRNVHSSPKFFNIADGGAGTHKPTPFQQKILVWTKTYESESVIPKRITRSQMKNAMDKFRVKVSVGMLGVTFISAAIVALYGRQERAEGKTLHKEIMERRRREQ